MKANAGRAYGETKLVSFLEKRVAELKTRKTQVAIATEAGFRQPNMLAMVKNGSARLPLDRVQGLALALECDPAFLFRLTLEQMAGESSVSTVEEMFGTILTHNEMTWISEIRQASGDTDPCLTDQARTVVSGMFDCGGNA